MTWFFIALAAPAIWAAVNHIDKYIITRYFQGTGVGSLVMFTSLSGFIFSVFIFLFNFSSLSLSPASITIIMFNGALLVAAFIPYCYAMQQEEASWVSTMYQLIPVFSYFLALIFLKEHLSVMQLLASAVVVIGAIIVSLDLSEKITFKTKPVLLMLLSSFMLALSALIFKVVALDEQFWGTAFWEYAGGAIFGLLLFAAIPNYRRQFIATIKRNTKIVLGLNIFSELLNVVAKLLANFASLLAPLALVWVVNGFQPAIVFVYAIILTVFFPHLGQENLSKKYVIQRLAGIAVMFVGVALLFK